MTYLTKTQKVLDRLEVTRFGTTYGFEDEDTGKDISVLTLSDADVRDFGNPAQVTVTIVAGDQLN